MDIVVPLNGQRTGELQNEDVMAKRCNAKFTATGHRRLPRHRPRLFRNLHARHPLSFSSRATAHPADCTSSRTGEILSGAVREGLGEGLEKDEGAEDGVGGGGEGEGIRWEEKTLRSGWKGIEGSEGPIMGHKITTFCTDAAEIAETSQV